MINGYAYFCNNLTMSLPYIIYITRTPRTHASNEQYANDKTKRHLRPQRLYILSLYIYFGRLFSKDGWSQVKDNVHIMYITYTHYMHVVMSACVGVTWLSTHYHDHRTVKTVLCVYINSGYEHIKYNVDINGLLFCKRIIPVMYFNLCYKWLYTHVALIK